VVANPTLSGNEAELTGIEVAGTKYKVPSGGGGSTPQHLFVNYLHYYNGDNKISFTLIATTDFFRASFSHVLGYISKGTFIPACGIYNGEPIISLRISMIDNIITISTPSNANVDVDISSGWTGDNYN